MIKPDWTKAPDQSTHWDELAYVFCDAGGWWHKNQYAPVENKDWGTDRYIPRPVESKDKTEELIMIKPDWTKAPEEATHWDIKHGLFCNASGWWGEDGRYIVQSGHNGWGTDRYTPRPVDSKDKTEELR